MRGAGPVLNIENTTATVGAGPVLNFGHNQSSSTIPLARIAGSLVNGGAATRAGDLVFSTAAAGVVTERMRIMSDGKVGIGTNAPGYNLHVVGTAGLSTGTAWTNASDIRLKDIDGDYEYGLNEVLKLHTVRYHYKKNNALKLPSEHAMTGIIAQEVQSVIPDAIRTREDGYLELNIDPIHWAVVNAVKELHSEIQERDQKIQKLESEVAGLKAYLCAKDAKAAFCH